MTEDTLSNDTIITDILDNDISIALEKLSISSDGVIHLVRTQNFLKSQHFLPPDIHTYVLVVHNVSFPENFAYVLNG